MEPSSISSQGAFCLRIPSPTNSSLYRKGPQHDWQNWSRENFPLTACTFHLLAHICERSSFRPAAVRFFTLLVFSPLIFNFRRLSVAYQVFVSALEMDVAGAGAGSWRRKFPKASISGWCSMKLGWHAPAWRWNCSVKSSLWHSEAYPFSLQPWQRDLE